VLPYGRQWITEEDVDAVAEVLRGDWLTTGPAVDAFEAALSEWSGGVECVSVTSGTAALHTAYAAMAVGRGDVVLTSPMTFVATASTALLLGARVAFVDVEADTGLIDPSALSDAIDDSTSVVTAVDYAGHPADYGALRPLCQEHGALLLSDAAHSIGSIYRGKPVAAWADVTAYSFFPTKNMTTAEGGAVCTGDRNVADRARLFRSHGLVRDTGRQRTPDEGGWHQEVHQLGLNYRLPDVLCALGISQLRRLAAFKRRRTELVARYNSMLADVPGLALPPQRPDVDPAWHLYPLRVLDGRRREVYDAMRAAGIGVQVNYVPVYWHPAFEDLGYRRGLCPRAEEYYRQELSLPLFPAMSDSDQDRVVGALRWSLGVDN
jgi:perosamine synthetase